MEFSASSHQALHSVWFTAATAKGWTSVKDVSQVLSVATR
jgi:hypothetical protein